MNICYNYVITEYLEKELKSKIIDSKCVGKHSRWTGTGYIDYYYHITLEDKRKFYITVHQTGFAWTPARGNYSVGWAEYELLDDVINRRKKFGRKCRDLAIKSDTDYNLAKLLVNVENLDESEAIRYLKDIKNEIELIPMYNYWMYVANLMNGIDKRKTAIRSIIPAYLCNKLNFDNQGNSRTLANYILGIWESKIKDTHSEIEDIDEYFGELYEKYYKNKNNK